MDDFSVKLIKSPTEEDWDLVKYLALLTANKKMINKPTFEWKHKILKARHSPIRELKFIFEMQIPYYVSVHLCRHVHAQPYVSTQRNDRQDNYDRNSAPQDAMVKMIWDMNAEELISVMHKRLCAQASPETRQVAEAMRKAVLEKRPEFEEVLVPNCVYRNGLCTEFKPCGAAEALLKKYKKN